MTCPQQLPALLAGTRAAPTKAALLAQARFETLLRGLSLENSRTPLQLIIQQHILGNAHVKVDDLRAVVWALAKQPPQLQALAAMQLMYVGFLLTALQVVSGSPEALACILAELIPLLQPEHQAGGLPADVRQVPWRRVDRRLFHSGTSSTGAGHGTAPRVTQSDDSASRRALLELCQQAQTCLACGKPEGQRPDASIKPTTLQPQDPHAAMDSARMHGASRAPGSGPMAGQHGQLGRSVASGSTSTPGYMRHTIRASLQQRPGPQKASMQGTQHLQGKKPHAGQASHAFRQHGPEASKSRQGGPKQATLAELDAKGRPVSLSQPEHDQPSIGTSAGEACSQAASQLAGAFQSAESSGAALAGTADAQRAASKQGTTVLEARAGSQAAIPQHSQRSDHQGWAGCLLCGASQPHAVAIPQPHTLGEPDMQGRPTGDAAPAQLQIASHGPAAVRTAGSPKTSPAQHAGPAAAAHADRRLSAGHMAAAVMHPSDLVSNQQPLQQATSGPDASPQQQAGMSPAGPQLSKASSGLSAPPQPQASVPSQPAKPQLSLAEMEHQAELLQQQRQRLESQVRRQRLEIEAQKRAIQPGMGPSTGEQPVQNAPPHGASASRQAAQHAPLPGISSSGPTNPAGHSLDGGESMQLAKGTLPRTGASGKGGASGAVAKDMEVEQQQLQRQYDALVAAVASQRQEVAMKRQLQQSMPAR